MAHHAAAAGTTYIHGNVVHLQRLVFRGLYTKTDIASGIVVLGLRPAFAHDDISLCLAVGIVSSSFRPCGAVGLQGGVVLNHHTVPLLVKHRHTTFRYTLVISQQWPESPERGTTFQLYSLGLDGYFNTLLA